MTRPLAAIPAAAGLLSLIAGCGVVLGLIAPHTTTVRLVNNSDFEVRVSMFIDDHQETPREVLTELGTNLEFSLAPGETASFSRDCDELQAIVIDKAELRIVGQVGPEADTHVLRDGTHFDCADLIVFTFDHSPLIVDFDISIEVQRN